MGLFDRLKEPVFLKESSNAQEQLEKLKELEPLLNPEGQALIRQDIKCLEYGIAGEKNIAFELKNSHMPMYILHDLYLEDGELSAQIDYLVFTKKISFVIECKNLIGDVEINSSGDFIRTTEFGGRKKKEGIYSPITQNQRHLELMKKIKVDHKSNILTKFIVGRFFEDSYKSVVVLANPKTVLNAKYAKKEVKEKVIRADQLVKHIKEKYDQSNAGIISEERLQEWAMSYLYLHKDVKRDYTERYEQYKVEVFKSEISKIADPSKEEKIGSKTEAMVPVEDTVIFKELKAYRLSKSREEKMKPYFIYSDQQLKDLISKMPKSMKELQAVAGFGEIKAKKYGDDILRIVENCK